MPESDPEIAAGWQSVVSRPVRGGILIALACRQDWVRSQFRVGLVPELATLQRDS